MPIEITETMRLVGELYPAVKISLIIKTEDDINESYTAMEFRASLLGASATVTLDCYDSSDVYVYDQLILLVKGLVNDTKD